MTQIPRGPKEFKCPLWQKPMSQVCHTCPLWTQLRGVDPQTGQDISDEWNCALGHLPRLLIENSQMSRQTGASVDMLRSLIGQGVSQMVTHRSNGAMLIEDETDGTDRR